MLHKINTNIDVCLTDGSQARIINTDRKNTKHSIIALCGDKETIEEFDVFGTNKNLNGCTLINKAVYTGLKNGMVYNPGYQPEDFDAQRPVLLRNGRMAVTSYSRWDAVGGVSEIILYWPVEEKIKLELTVNEAKALNAILRRVGGSPDVSARKYMDELLSKLYRGMKHIPFDSEFADTANGRIMFNDFPRMMGSKSV